eukprot:gnl/Trimastix_PCT/3164.p1 GENE.gnl/Trimastix_PCT/3164~~gnl/Trimastix_PCT/3164.p1  ORF type:complete len:619 (+),score=110.36 gnl/Trimastix_PCT/3164:53-1858(+)
MDNKTPPPNKLQWSSTSPLERLPGSSPSPDPTCSSSERLPGGNIMCDNECGASAQHWCTSCEISLCDPCWAQTHRLGALKKHVQCPLSERNTNAGTLATQQQPTCAMHGHQPIILFCRKAQAPFCNECFAQSTDVEKASCCSLNGDVVQAVLSELSHQCGATQDSARARVQAVTSTLDSHAKDLNLFLCDLQQAERTLAQKRLEFEGQLAQELEALAKVQGPEAQASLEALRGAMQEAEEVLGRRDELLSMGFLIMALCTLEKLRSARDAARRLEGAADTALRNTHAPCSLIELNRSISSLQLVSQDRTCLSSAPLRPQRVYISGGVTLSRPPTSSVSAFDIAASRWLDGNTVSSMQHPRFQHGMCSLDGNLCAMGAAIVGVKATAEMYSPSANTWKMLPNMLVERNGPAPAPMQGNLYVMGGRRTLQVEIYDPGANLWCYGPSLPVTYELWIPAAVSHGQSIYIVGGEDQGKHRNTLFRLDPRVDQWKTLTPMPTKRDDLSVVATEDALYVIGGGYKDRFLDTVEKYDVRADRWTSCRPLRVKRGGLASVYLGEGQVMACGGWDGRHNLDIVEIFDLRTETWKDGPRLPLARGYTAGVAL